MFTYEQIARWFSDGPVVLVTGAGLSQASANAAGQPIPGTRELTSLLWEVFDNESCPTDAALADAFSAARSADPEAVEQLLEDRFRVDPGSVTEWQRKLFAFPWHRVYTMNVDDLARAVSEQRGGPSLDVRSALRRGWSPTDRRGSKLQVIHVNGDLLDGIRCTFTDADFAQRSAVSDTTIGFMASELASYHTVFVATTLHELHLWTALTMRDMTSRAVTGVADLRPPGVLVVPSIDAARKMTLRGLNIDHLPATCEEFVSELTKRGVAGGALRSDPDDIIVSVTDKIAASLGRHDTDRALTFLMGAEPKWSDIGAHAIQRPAVADLRELLGNAADLVVVFGNAGAGKTTAAMQFAVSARAAGADVGWCLADDAETEAELVRGAADWLAVGTADQPRVLVIDNAEAVAYRAQNLLRVANGNEGRQIVAVSRRGGMHRGWDRLGGPGVGFVEISNLSTSEVEDLTRMLENEGLARPGERLSRELIAVLLQRTKGEGHKARVFDEYQKLDPELQVLYAVAAQSKSFGFPIPTTLLIAGAGHGAASLADISRLAEIEVVRVRDRGQRPPVVEPRHRLIGEALLEALGERGDSLAVRESLARCLALDHDLGDRDRKPTRALAVAYNHDNVMRELGQSQGAEFYRRLQGLLGRDHHYWLHRGLFYLMVGDDHECDEALGRAKALGHGDVFVDVACLQRDFDRARKISDRERLRTLEKLFEDGTALCQSFGQRGGHTFAVVGQGVARGVGQNLDPSATAALLGRAIRLVEGGVEKFPHDSQLEESCNALRSVLATIA